MQRAGTLRYIGPPRPGPLLNRPLGDKCSNPGKPSQANRGPKNRGRSGRIYEKHSSPEHLRWFWSLFCPSKPESLRISNQVASLELAKAEFEASWKQWKAWAGLEESAPKP